MVTLNSPLCRIADRLWMLPCTSLEARGAKGWLSSFSISEDDLLDLLFTRKNTTIVPTIRMDITIPAMPPPPIPDLLLPPPEPPSDGELLLPDLWFLLFLLAGGVPGGGGGAGPELHELPSFLSMKIIQIKIAKNLFWYKIETTTLDNAVKCLLQINTFQLIRYPASKMVIGNIPVRHKSNYHKGQYYRSITL